MLTFFRKTRTHLLLDAPEAKNVAITGDFKKWDTRGTPLRRDPGGRWSITLALKPGFYQYRFIVDGEWIADPANEQRITNPYGEYNSILEVK